MLPKGSGWADWTQYSEHAKPVVESYVVRLGHAPHGMTLIREGYGWIYFAARQHHHGFHAVLRRWEIVVPRHPNHGGQSANWDLYKELLLSATAAYRAEHTYLPGNKIMVRLGWSRFVNAAFRYHQGWAAVRRRLRLYPPPAKSSVVMRIRRRHEWANASDSRARVLFSDFSAWSEWGVMPPQSRVRKKFPGLVGYWYRQGFSWSSLARYYRLVQGRGTLAHWYLCRGLVETLHFVTSHGRWPKAKECSPFIRHWRYHHCSSWAAAFNSIQLPPPIFDRLRPHLHQHIRQIRRHHPALERDQASLMNALVISHNSVINNGR